MRKFILYYTGRGRSGAYFWGGVGTGRRADWTWWKMYWLQHSPPFFPPPFSLSHSKYLLKSHGFFFLNIQFLYFFTTNKKTLYVEECLMLSHHEIVVCFIIFFKKRNITRLLEWSFCCLVCLYVCSLSLSLFLKKMSQCWGCGLSSGHETWSTRCGWASKWGVCVLAASYLKEEFYFSGI